MSLYVHLVLRVRGSSLEVDWSSTSSSESKIALSFGLMMSLDENSTKMDWSDASSESDSIRLDLDLDLDLDFDCALFAGGSAVSVGCLRGRPTFRTGLRGRDAWSSESIDLELGLEMGLASDLGTDASFTSGCQQSSVFRKSANSVSSANFSFRRWIPNSDGTGTSGDGLFLNGIFLPFGLPDASSVHCCSSIRTSSFFFSLPTVTFTPRFHSSSRNSHTYISPADTRSEP
mmetsp:Transcript_7093/g.8818  ORF Transcript_7093/g.8818 Transcript_7093/m.8818 type:complete len:231 (+) Transcript_7093:2317-3009(+)